MAYLVIALVFLSASFIFNIAAVIWLDLDQFTLAGVVYVLSFTTCVGSIGFFLTWIAWLFGVI